MNETDMLNSRSAGAAEDCMEEIANASVSDNCLYERRRALIREFAGCAYIDGENLTPEQLKEERISRIIAKSF